MSPTFRISPLSVRSSSTINEDSIDVRHSMHWTVGPEASGARIAGRWETVVTAVQQAPPRVGMLATVRNRRGLATRSSPATAGPTAPSTSSRSSTSTPTAPPRTSCFGKRSSSARRRWNHRRCPISPATPRWRLPTSMPSSELPRSAEPRPRRSMPVLEDARGCSRRGEARQPSAGACSYPAVPER